MPALVFGLLDHSTVRANRLMDMAIVLHDGLCGPTRHRSAMSSFHDTTRRWDCCPQGQRAHALRAVRQFAWLEVGSGKAAWSRPGRAPGWCPIPPTSTPKEHTHTR